MQPRTATSLRGRRQAISGGRPPPKGGQSPASIGGEPASPTTAPAGGTWAPNVQYAVGAQVTYAGVAYRCRQAHRSLVTWEPPNTPALWQRL